MVVAAQSKLLIKIYFKGVMSIENKLNGYRVVKGSGKG